MGPQNSKQRTEVHVVHHYLNRGYSETESHQHEVENSLQNILEDNSGHEVRESISDIWRECDTGYFVVDPSVYEHNTVKPTDIVRQNNSKQSIELPDEINSKLVPTGDRNVARVSDSSSSKVITKWKQMVFRNKYKSSPNINQFTFEDHLPQHFTSQIQLNQLTYNNSKDQNLGNLDEHDDDDGGTQVLKRGLSWSNLSDDNSSCKTDDTFSTPTSLSCSCSCSLDDSDDSISCCEHINKSQEEAKFYKDQCISSNIEAFKPVEYVDFFEVDSCGEAIFPTVWHNVMWREATRAVDLTTYHCNNMATTSSSGPKMFGPPKIPNTPSKAINNMLRTKCGKPVPNQAKFLVTSVICKVFNIITMIYNQIHKDTIRPSHKMWMISCGIVGALTILFTVLAYQIVINSAFLMHAMLYYGCIALALAGTGLCVSGAIFFDKEGAKEDFTKEG